MKSLNDYTLKNYGSLIGLKNCEVSGNLKNLKALDSKYNISCNVCSGTEDYSCPLIEEEICLSCCRDLKNEKTCMNTKCQWYK